MNSLLARQRDEILRLVNQLESCLNDLKETLLPQLEDQELSLLRTKLHLEINSYRYVAALYTLKMNLRQQAMREIGQSNILIPVKEQQNS